MSNYEVSKAIRLTNTAARLERDRRLARQQRARQRCRRRPVTQGNAIDAERVAAQEPTGEVPL